MHGEHWVDLILAQAGSSDPRYGRAFQQTLSELLQGVRDGHLSEINEKIDGSPSIVVGFKTDGQPFVAYKGQFSRKQQTLLAHSEDIHAAFERTPQLELVFKTLLETLAPIMNQRRAEFGDLIFQGDLLFVEGGERRSLEGDQIKITANSLTYTFAPTHPLYEAVRTARVGIVFHSVGTRVVEPDGRLSVRALEDEGVIRQFAEKLRTPEVFVVDPWQSQIRLSKAAEFTPAQHQQIALWTEQIQNTMTELPNEFRDVWAKKFAAKWRTFLNTGLHPPEEGGFYLEASKGQGVDSKYWIGRFSVWLKGRGELALERAFTTFLESHQAELETVLDAYGSAVAIQYALMPYLSEAFRSKLGGGDVEGLMLKTDDTVVKLVDRLDFTLKNNARWKRTSDSSSQQIFSQFAAPLNRWRPDAAVVILKGQPIHAGHVQMIRRAALQYPGQPLYIFLSDSVPNLAAPEWRGLKVAATKKALEQRNYTYVFQPEFRRKLLLKGLEGIHAEVHILNPAVLWKYLRVAKDARLPGSVNLIVGEKEISAHRYDKLQDDLAPYLKVVPIQLQADGLSATKVRASLRKAAVGDRAERHEALQELDRDFSFIANPTTRRRWIGEMIRQWQGVDRAVQGVLGGSGS